MKRKIKENNKIIRSFKMAKFKLPESLKAWKVLSRLEDVNGNAVYKVVKKEIDGSTTNALLTGVSLEGESYTDDNVEYLLNESDFIQSIINIGRVSNYIAVATDENERKEKFDLYIVTEDIPTLSDVLQTTQMEEKDIVDFGIQMSEILEKLAENKVFHGNIKPSNIYVTPNNRYKLGGFIDAESKVNDLTYVAPEIQRNEKADYTTDIYSTGLVMYSMANNGKLPFEDVDVTPKEAMIKRFNGETVTAPQNGSEKLKSVIVIACQPENGNRWKNAGNLKNALNSIKAEIEADEEAKANVIVPETTDFEGNVFEDDNDGASETAVLGAAAAAAAGFAVSGEDKPVAEAEKAPVDEAADLPVNEPEKPEYGQTEVLSDKKPEADKLSELESRDNFDDEIDNRVFDDYKLETKVFSLNDAIKSGDKDYGDYFEEPEPEKPEAPVNNSELEDYTVFDDQKQPEEKKKKSKKGLVAAIIIGVVVLLALLGTFGFFALTKGLFGGVNPFDNKQETTSSASTEDTTAQDTTAEYGKSQQVTTAPATTAPATEKPTEAPKTKSLIRVVGEPLDTAKQMLEAEGFKVEIGEYYYDDFYYEGNVVSQSPEAYTEVKAGSVITLNISLGPEKKESSESSESDSDDDDDEVVFSSCAYNTSYLSKDEVEDMSREDLNLALNEIYARRGRIFTDPGLDSYFRSQDWYTPKYSASEFEKKVVFNDFEEKNINLILNEQSERGYR